MGSHRSRPIAVLAALAGAVCLVGCDDSDTSPSSPTAAPTTTATHTTTSDGGTGGSGGGGDAGAAGAGGDVAIDTCGIGELPAGGAGGGLASGRVRVVAANLTSGNYQSYDGGHGLRILQGLAADVILLQEMNYGDDSLAAMGTFVDEVCDGHCRYVRGPQAEIPNGVLSRLPFLECGSWVDPEVSNRNFVWGRLDAPGDADLWAISVHLLSSSSTDRAAEATALLNRIAGAIPPGDMIVLGGDLNTNTRTEQAVTTLASVFDTAGPYPADQNGNSMTNAPRNEPYDWVLADAELAAHQVSVLIGASEFTAGAVIDTRVYTPLAEIAPARVDDSDAPSMQHMAVVKDFQLTP